MTGRTTLLIPATLVVALPLVACTQTTAGESAPQTTTSSAQPETSTAPPTTTVAPPGSPDYLTRDALCALLTDADVAGLGLRPGEPGDTAVGDEECRWTGGTDGTLSVTYSAEDGVADFNELPGFTYTDVALGDHTGVRAERPEGDRCFIDLVITESSSVGIRGTGGPGQGCALLDRGAPLIEANLP